MPGAGGMTTGQPEGEGMAWPSLFSLDVLFPSTDLLRCYRHQTNLSRSRRSLLPLRKAHPPPIARERWGGGTVGGEPLQLRVAAEGAEGQDVDVVRRRPARPQAPEHAQRLRGERGGGRHRGEGNRVRRT